MNKTTKSILIIVIFLAFGFGVYATFYKDPALFNLARVVPAELEVAELEDQKILELEKSANPAKSSPPTTEPNPNDLPTAVLSVSELLDNKDQYYLKQVTVRDVISFDFLGTTEEGGSDKTVNVHLGPLINSLRLFQSGSYISCQSSGIITSCQGFERGKTYKVVGSLQVVGSIENPSLTSVFVVKSATKL